MDVLCWCSRQGASLTRTALKAGDADDTLYKKQASPNTQESGPVSQGWHHFYGLELGGADKRLKDGKEPPQRVWKMDAGLGSPVLGDFPCDTHRCYDWGLFPCLSQGNQEGRAGHSSEALTKEKFGWLTRKAPEAGASKPTHRRLRRPAPNPRWSTETTTTEDTLAAAAAWKRSWQGTQPPSCRFSHRSQKEH